MKARKSILLIIVGASLILFLGLSITMKFAQWTKVQREFASVQVGQSRSTVLGKLGKPNYYAGLVGGLSQIHSQHAR